MQSSYLLGGASALGSAACFAIGAVLWRKLGDKISPLSMNIAKSIIGSCYLLLALFFLGFGTMDSNAVILLAASGVIGISIGDTFFFKSLYFLGSRIAALMATLTAGFIAIAAFFVLGERPSSLAWVGIVLTSAGVAWVVSNRKYQQEIVLNKRKGVGFALLSILCSVVGILLAKKGLASISAIQGLFIRFLSAAVILIVWTIITGKIKSNLVFLGDRKLFAQVAGLVFLGTFGGFFLSLNALKYIDASIASCLNSTAPLFILPLVAVCFRERIGVRAVGGALLAVAGLILTVLGGNI